MTHLSISHDDIDYSFLYKIHLGANCPFFYYDVTYRNEYTEEYLISTSSTEQTVPIYLAEILHILI